MNTKHIFRSTVKITGTVFFALLAGAILGAVQAFIVTRSEYDTAAGAIVGAIVSSILFLPTYYLTNKKLNDFHFVFIYLVCFVCGSVAAYFIQFGSIFVPIALFGCLVAFLYIRESRRPAA